MSESMMPQAIESKARGLRVEIWLRRGAGLVAALLALWLVWLGGYHYLHPRRSTRYAAGYTPEKFATVRAGMTEDELVGLLGEPLYVDRRRYEDGEFREWYYSHFGTGNVMHFEAVVVLFDPATRLVHRPLVEECWGLLGD